MEKIRQGISLIEKDEDFRKRFFIITLMTALFILALILKKPSVGGKYIIDDNGNVVGIQRGSLRSSEEYSLDLLICCDDETEKRSVVIKKQAASDKKDNQNAAEENRKQERDAEITEIITGIELSQKKTITLPNKLSDGTKLYWSVKKEKIGTGNSMLIFFSYIALVLLVAEAGLKKERNDEIVKRREIIRGLPRFTNQLLLMMNAGMILSDAFERVCECYSLLDMSKSACFEKQLIELSESNYEHRLSTAKLIGEFAAEQNVKELMRISVILTENEKRGSDVIDNLSRESRYLWDERKAEARESGKMIDTRMSYPLGLLLILLIVITMAPALLSM